MKKQTETKVNLGGSTDFISLLTILFIGLKLTNNISWSWPWVLSPILIPLTILIFIGVVGYLSTKVKI